MKLELPSILITFHGSKQPEINVSISKFEMLIFENESGIFCLSRSFTISLPA